jgi:hypothetical protein
LLAAKLLIELTLALHELAQDVGAAEHVSLLPAGTAGADGLIDAGQPRIFVSGADELAAAVATHESLTAADAAVNVLHQRHSVGGAVLVPGTPGARGRRPLRSPRGATAESSLGRRLAQGRVAEHHGRQSDARSGDRKQTTSHRYLARSDQVTRRIAK